jgi:hypothetical protein
MEANLIFFAVVLLGIVLFEKVFSKKYRRIYKLDLR